jgi:hypothetical protein
MDTAPKAETLRQPASQTPAPPLPSGGQAELARRATLLQVPGPAAAPAAGTPLRPEPPPRPRAWFDEA